MVRHDHSGLFTAFALEALEGRSGLHILDMDCEEASLAALHPKAKRLVGLVEEGRVSPLATRFAAHPAVSIVSSSASLPSGSFDVALVRLHRADAPVRAVAEAQRLLRPGGHAIVFAQRWKEHGKYVRIGVLRRLLAQGTSLSAEEYDALFASFVLRQHEGIAMRFSPSRRVMAVYEHPFEG